MGIAIVAVLIDSVVTGIVGWRLTHKAEKLTEDVANSIDETAEKVAKQIMDGFK